MYTRLRLSLVAAAAAAFMLPTTASASPAHTAVTPHALTNCQKGYIPLSQVTGDPDSGYLVMGYCEGSGTYYVTVTCPDGSFHTGTVVTLPTDVSGGQDSITGCPSGPAPSMSEINLVFTG